MKNESENTRLITKSIMCPYCGLVAKYQISLESVTGQAASKFGWLVYSALLGTLFTLFLVNGWKVLGLALIGAILIFSITMIITLIGQILIKSVWRLIQQLRSSQSDDETTLRQLTVVLKCPNPDCPDSTRSFQAKLWLPLNSDGLYSINIASAEIQG